MNVEQWTRIDNYDNYELSNFGNIRNRKTMKMLKPGICGQGHMKVSLYKNGKGKTHGVHVLVAKGFVDNPHNKKIVGHIDKNPTNNHFENERSEFRAFKNFLNAQISNVHFQNKFLNVRIPPVHFQNDLQNNFGALEFRPFIFKMISMGLSYRICSAKL